MRKSERKIKKFLRQMTNEWKRNHTKSLDAAKAVLRGKFIVMHVFLKKQGKISNKQPNLPPTGWTPGVGDGQGGLACCSSWGRKESDMTERLN